MAAYAEHFQQQGGHVIQAPLETLSRSGNGWRATVGGETIAAEQVVLALGPWSAQWLVQQRLHVPLFVKRGYHMHYGARDNARLHHWLMDSETGYLLAPMRAGIRLTTGAELARHDARPHYRQLAAAEAVARTLFPLGDRLDPQPWMGARPCTPDMKPVIGPAPRSAGPVAGLRARPPGLHHGADYRPAARTDDGWGADRGGYGALSGGPVLAAARPPPTPALRQPAPTRTGPAEPDGAH